MMLVEHDGSSYIATAPNTNSEPPSADWDLLAAKGDQGETGDDGAAGADGRHGGAITITYTFSTTTTDADPGNGNLRLNNATQNAATVIRADLLDNLGADWTSALGTLADSSSTVKGHGPDQVARSAY